MSTNLTSLTVKSTRVASTYFVDPFGRPRGFLITKREVGDRAFLGLPRFLGIFTGELSPPSIAGNIRQILVSSSKHRNERETTPINKQNNLKK